MRIPYDEVLETLNQILLHHSFASERAEICANLFAKASLEGVPSHGLDRFLVFLDLVKNNFVVPNAEMDLLHSSGLFEQYNGNLGPGPFHAHNCMYRAIQLAKEFGIGMVSIQNTNHWMRAGNYGWQAAEVGNIGICWSNTKPNMPAWGGSEPKLGNNPLVIAIPRQSGPVVLDMAMTQFSYGKLNTYLREGKMMPFDAGFDLDGKLTKNPKEVVQNDLALPIGLWKGAGLSLVLDMFASIISGGNAVHQIGKSGTEFGLSQVFISLDPRKLGISDAMDGILDDIIEDLKNSSTFAGMNIHYPGENIQQIRKENLENGVKVNETVWQKITEKLKAG